MMDVDDSDKLITTPVPNGSNRTLNDNNEKDGEFTTKSGGNKMGYWSCTSYVIGNIIGSGIFIAPSAIIRYTDSPGLSLVVWIVCALIALLGSLCYIELGTSIREAGCDFAYICYVKWYSIAFSFMWVSVLMTYPACIACISETFGQYMIEGLRQTYDLPPNLIPFAQKGFGISLLILVTWVNFFELGRFAARFQIAATVAKLGACSLIIFTGLYFYFFKGWKEGLRDGFWVNANLEAGNVAMALYGGLYAYSGWDILNYGADEIYRNVPMALISGILIVTGVYLTINVAYFAVLDIDTIKSSNAIAALFSQRTLGELSYGIPFLIGILLIGSLNSNLFSGSRYMYAASRQGHLPACFSCVNAATASPRVAVFAQSFLAIAISFVGDLDALIGYVIFGFWAQRLFTLLALITIRRSRLPVHPDAIRIPMPITYAFLFINCCLVIVPIWKDPAVTALGITLCFVGLIIYLFFNNYSHLLPRHFLTINERVTVICAIIFDALPEPVSSEGLPGRGMSLPAVSDVGGAMLASEEEHLHHHHQQHPSSASVAAIGLNRQPPAESSSYLHRNDHRKRRAGSAEGRIMSWRDDDASTVPILFGLNDLGGSVDEDEKDNNGTGSRSNTPPVFDLHSDEKNLRLIRNGSATRKLW